MNPNWLGVVSAILSIVAFYVTYRVASKLQPKSRFLLAVVACVLAIPSASFAIHYGHLFPEAGWYYHFRSLPGTEFLIILVGVAGGSLAAILPRVTLVLPLLGTVIFALVPFIKPFIGPFPDHAFSNEWKDNVCFQSSRSTCGAASTATILKLFGHDVTEAELAAEAHSYNGGTEAWYLARAIRARGLDVRFDTNSDLGDVDQFPAVAGVLLGSVGHFIPILGREGDKFVIGDPLRGKETLSREDLEKRYEFTGFYMRVFQE